jgi:AmmeMemoRadiSam system protein B
MSNCALSGCSSYETPFGDLKIDQSIINELSATDEFDMLDRRSDEEEHSLEMHLPYIYKVLRE